MLIKKVPKEFLLNLLEQLAESKYSKFFTVYFYKKDKTARKLIGRFNVTKYLHGGKRTSNPKEFFCIYDIINHGYRNVNKETIYKVQVAGTLYLVEN